MSAINEAAASPAIPLTWRSWSVCQADHPGAEQQQRRNHRRHTSDPAAWSWFRSAPVAAAARGGLRYAACSQAACVWLSGALTRLWDGLVLQRPRPMGGLFSCSFLDWRAARGGSTSRTVSDTAPTPPTTWPTDEQSGVALQPAGLLHVRSGRFMRSAMLLPCCTYPESSFMLIHLLPCEGASIGEVSPLSRLSTSVGCRST